MSKLKRITTTTKETSSMEFAQKLVVLSWVVTVIWITLSFILAFFDKDTNSAVTVALITESFGVTLAYLIYQAVLKNSRNKYEVDRDGVPYKVLYKLDGIIDTSDNISDNSLEE